MEIMIWLLIVIGTILIDLLTSNFIFMWFALGAIVAIIFSSFGASMAVQIIVFLFVGIVSIIIGYPIVVKRFKASQKTIPTMEESYIGTEMKATKEIIDKETIKLNGSYWTAYNRGKKISIGDKFIITGIEGTKLIVKLKED